MKAFLLAAGLGTRLRPLTDSVPKCLVPVGGRPLLDVWLDNLRAAGVDEVLINLHHMAEKVRSHLTAHRGEPRVWTSYEHTLLGSAGTLVAGRQFIGSDEVFLVVNGDDLTDFAVLALAADAFVQRQENLRASRQFPRDRRRLRGRAEQQLHHRQGDSGPADWTASAASSSPLANPLSPRAITP